AQGSSPCGVGYDSVISPASHLNCLSIPIGRQIYAELDVRGGGVYGVYGAHNLTVLAIRVCRRVKCYRGNVRTSSRQVDFVVPNVHAHKARTLPGRIVILDCVIIPRPSSLCATAPPWTEKDLAAVVNTDISLVFFMPPS